jgi:hypothetical protein
MLGQIILAIHLSSLTVNQASSRLRDCATAHKHLYKTLHGQLGRGYTAALLPASANTPLSGGRCPTDMPESHPSPTDQAHNSRGGTNCIISFLRTSALEIIHTDFPTVYACLPKMDSILRPRLGVGCSLLPLFSPSPRSPVRLDPALRSAFLPLPFLQITYRLSLIQCQAPVYIHIPRKQSKSKPSLTNTDAVSKCIL